MNFKVENSNTNFQILPAYGGFYRVTVNGSYTLITGLFTSEAQCKEAAEKYVQEAKERDTVGLLAAFRNKILSNCRRSEIGTVIF